MRVIKTHNYKGDSGWCCYHMRLPQGHTEGYQLDLSAARLNASTEEPYIHLISPPDAVAQPTIHKSVLTCELLSGVKHHSRLFCFFRVNLLISLRQGHTTSAMHNTFMTSGAVVRLYTNIPLHHVYLDYVSFSPSKKEKKRNRMHVSQHGSISSSSIMLFCLSCFDT